MTESTEVSCTCYATCCGSWHQADCRWCKS